ncbi:hypothetical protein Desor_0829 [Desulfosporosinus orientis DSM 765]|uniref:Uncharacterized protein n=1 Tax=Desulfosporosinus orientis (strain ATCC 19365 / DSM 765 / NCIMB 8382 / VKM B-1628 / Singapore I) TaxID=768706 RepID=G7WAG1_DESOD|nr:hypothetical protein [Desulfosporosinus orientis]AET66510.1 hypothetical protein Desor_0829 [Desulfosporosinus orientis DSM 765]
MVNPLNKLNIIFLALLLVLIMAAELILEPRHLAAWPAFLIMIFYFMSHMNIKEAPAILIGSAFGLLNLVLITYWMGVIVPMLGGDMTKVTEPHTAEAMFIAKLIYIALFVALIVFLKDIIPWVFNNYAFMCFTIAGAVSGGYTTAAIAAHTVAGYANAVAAAGDNPEAIAAMKEATEKAIAATVPTVNVFQWIGIELVVGSIFIVGIYGIGQLLAKLAGAPPANTDIHG